MSFLYEIGARTLGGFSKVVDKVNNYIEDKTGYDFVSELGKQVEKDEKERQEHYGRWALKKLAKGTLLGIFGGYMSCK